MKLKPCPFCAVEAHDGDKFEHRHGCFFYGRWTSLGIVDQEEVDRWNKRSVSTGDKENK